MSTTFGFEYAQMNSQNLAFDFAQAAKESLNSHSEFSFDKQGDVSFAQQEDAQNLYPVISEFGGDDLFTGGFNELCDVSGYDSLLNNTHSAPYTSHHNTMNNNNNNDVVLGNNNTNQRSTMPHEVTSNNNGLMQTTIQRQHQISAFQQQQQQGYQSQQQQQKIVVPSDSDISSPARSIPGSPQSVSSSDSAQQQCRKLPSSLEEAHLVIAALNQTIGNMSAKLTELETECQSHRVKAAEVARAQRTSIDSNMSIQDRHARLCADMQSLKSAQQPTATSPTMFDLAALPSAAARLPFVAAAVNAVNAHQVSSVASSACSPSRSISSSAGSFKSSTAEEPTTRLSLVGQMELLWYADRPYPHFNLQLVDDATGRPVSPQKTTQVHVSLLDGYGQQCDKLGGPASGHDFMFCIARDGTVEISNIRFTSVSSKIGGHYQLVAEVVDSADGSVSDSAECKPQSWVSEKIQVLSYRLFHSPKLEFSQLQATDSLSKVKGIGSLYAQRFAQMGISTVNDLACLDTSDTPQPNTINCETILESLRKVRGALTRSKLVEYVMQAREVVDRCRGQPTQAPQKQQPNVQSRSKPKQQQQRQQQEQSKRRKQAPRRQFDQIEQNPADLQLFCDFTAQQQPPQKRGRVTVVPQQQQPQHQLLQQQQHCFSVNDYPAF